MTWMAVSPGQPADTHVPDAEGNVRAKLADGYFDCSHAWIPCDRNTSSEEWQTALKVRLALNYSIDRQKLVNNLTYGEGSRPISAIGAATGCASTSKGWTNWSIPTTWPRPRSSWRMPDTPMASKLTWCIPDLFPQGKPGAQAVCGMWLEANNVQCNERNEPYSASVPHSWFATTRASNSHGLGQQNRAPCGSCSSSMTSAAGSTTASSTPTSKL